MKTVGMGAKPKTDPVGIATGDPRADSAVKKENAALKKANAELSQQIEALTARVAELEAAAAASTPD